MKPMQKINASSFKNGGILQQDSVFESIQLVKTKGEHGKDEELLKIISEVCGVVFKYPSEKLFGMMLLKTRFIHINQKSLWLMVETIKHYGSLIMEKISMKFIRQLLMLRL